jgi:hypothetical protein
MLEEYKIVCKKNYELAVIILIQFDASMDVWLCSAVA